MIISNLNWAKILGVETGNYYIYSGKNRDRVDVERLGKRLITEWKERRKTGMKKSI